ncbi:MAG TPA: spermidine/putrescine ABC transporter substrate-binding protein [Gemmatimonadales bacterium]|jgi:spermidine/putrescine transport system substrate-binding protein
MSESDTVEHLGQGLALGRLSRRDLLALAGALGLSLSSLGTLLTACARGETADEQATVADELGAIERELNVYNWSDYVAADTIANFEREFGVKVTYDTYESNEEMLTRLQAGGSGYDIIVPSNYVVPVAVAADLVAPLMKQYIPNLENLDSTFLDPVFDPGNRYAVPYQWGTTGLAWRTDKLRVEPDSWSILLDVKYRGKMTQMDDMREVIGAWLRFRGKSLNSTDPTELAQARADALAARKNLKAYVSAAVKGQLISGDVWVAQLWNGDTAQARAEQPSIGYLVPKEGCTIWTDSMMVTRSASHRRAAHEFINYILRPEVGADISNTTGYGSPNKAAFPSMKNPVAYPTPLELQRLEYQQDLGGAIGLWEAIWTELRGT